MLVEVSDGHLCVISEIPRHCIRSSQRGGVGLPLSILHSFLFSTATLGPAHTSVQGKFAALVLFMEWSSAWRSLYDRVLEGVRALSVNEIL